MSDQSPPRPRIYDITIDNWRDVTQEDVDLMVHRLTQHVRDRRAIRPDEAMG